MKIIALLLLKDLRILINDRIALLMMLVVPMVLILVFGLIMGGGGGSPTGIRLLIVDQAETESSKRLIAALERESAFSVLRNRVTEEGSRPLTEDDVRDLITNNASSYRFGIIIPTGFESDEIGFKLRFINNPQNSIESAMVMGLFQRAFFTELPSLFLGRTTEYLKELNGEEGWLLFRDRIGSFGPDLFNVSSEEVLEGFDSMFDSMNSGEAGESLFAQTPGEGGDLFNNLLQIENEQIFGKGRNASTQSLAGFAAMFLLFGLTGAATSMFDDRNQQIMHRLLSGPVSRYQILAGKYLYSMILGILQLLVLFIFGHLVFSTIASVAQIPLLLLMMVALSAAATGFGMVICAFTRTQAQASGISTMIILTMSALGGAMIPAFMFPAIIRDYLTPLTLVHWGVDGFLGILWRDASLVELMPNFGVLLLFTVIALAVATPRFLRDSTFSR